MNRKQITLALGALVLTVGGAFAGRASAKFSQLHAWFKSTTNACTELTIASSASDGFASSGTNPATILTTGGTNLPLYITSTCGATSIAYFTN
jgi:hypothetical protein